MPDFDLATGYVTFRGNLDLLEKDIQKAEEKVKQLDKSLNAPAGKQKFEMALYAAKGINAELAKSKATADRLAQSILGPTQKQLEAQRKQAILAENRQHRDESWLARREFREKKAEERQKIAAENRQNRDEAWLARREMKETRAAERAEMKAKKQGMVGLRNFGLGATAMAGGALALGAGSSPLAGSTLEGSWKLLMTEIGGTFTPLVRDVSKWLQDTSKTVGSLSDSTKEYANETVKLVFAMGTAALAIAGLNKGLTLISRNPLLAMFSAGAGIAGFVNSRWSAGTDAQILASQTRNQTLDPKNVMQEQRSRQLAGLSARAAKLGAEGDFKRAWADYEEKRQTYEEFRTGFGGGNIKGGLWRLADTFTFGSIEAKKLQDVETSQAEFERSKIRLQRFGGVKLPERKGGKGADMLWGDMGPVSSIGVADLFKSFQTAGLKGGLAGAQAKTEQEQMLELMQGWDAKIKGAKLEPPIAK